MHCYNEEATILQVAKCVLDSPYTAEPIIVDDGSTDSSITLVDTLTDDQRVRLIQQTHNMGKGAAVHRGFSESTLALHAYSGCGSRV